MKITWLLLLVTTIAASGSKAEDIDLVFDKDLSAKQDDQNLQDQQPEGYGLGNTIMKIKDDFFAMFGYASSTETPPEVIDSSPSRVKRQAGRGSRHDGAQPPYEEDDYPERRDSRRRSRLSRSEDDEDEEWGSSNGSGDHHESPPHTPGREMTIRVTFTVHEPYRSEFSNRDSKLFQDLSRTLGDAVTSLFDSVQGEQHARLVRIQSRPADDFTCKVTLELQTLNFYDTDKIINTLRDHIRDNRRLGSVTVDDREFEMQRFSVVGPRVTCGKSELACRSGDCVDVSKRCDGHRDCIDGSDEAECPTESSGVTHRTMSGLDEFIPVPPEVNIPNYDESTDYDRSGTEYPGGDNSATSVPIIDENTEQPDERPEYPPRQPYPNEYDERRDSRPDQERPEPIPEHDRQSRPRPESRPEYERPESRPEYERPESRPDYDHPESRPDYERPESRTEYDRPESRPDYERPESRPDYERPESRPEYERPESRPDYERPESRPDYERPESRTEYDRPESRPDYERPESQPDYERPESRPEYGRPESRPDYERPDYENPESRTEYDYERPETQTEYERPESRPDYERPESRPEYERPGSRPDYERPESGRDPESATDSTDEDRRPEPTRCRADDQQRCGDTSSYYCSQQMCDGIYDCPYGEDEVDCPPTDSECTSDDFSCDGRRCVSLERRCDGVPDCTDGADERDCSLDSACSSDQYACNDRKCIEGFRRCDTYVDCSGGEDEENCPCPEGDFRCGDGKCIDASRHCDDNPDCNDLSDEIGCAGVPENDRCDRYSFACSDGACVPNKYRCDGKSDCPDSSDEDGCSVVPPGNCDIRCGNGACVDNSKRCNGIFDCPDGTDERDCGVCQPGEFRCTTGHCVNVRTRCDGVADCPDLSDEFNCPTPPVCGPGSVSCDGKCVDPKYKCDGTSDCSNGEDEINCSDSDCEGKHTCPDGTCFDYELVCDGNPDCSDGSDERYCDTGCRPDEWSCSSGDCISKSKRCNGDRDCADGSDESSCSPPYGGTTSRPYYTPPPQVTPRPTWSPAGTNARLNLKTYPNEQIIRQSPYPKGGEVVFQCRDEGPLRARVAWKREGGRPLPAGSIDRNGRLEMPNIQVTDSGTYICHATEHNKNTPGAELSVRLTVEPHKTDFNRPVQSCKLNEATCSNGDCIPKNSVCNGNFDCSDGSDELACNIQGLCEPNEFRCNNKRCVLKTWLCDSEDDCKDGSDEANCAVGIPGAACSPHEFQCRSGQCVPRNFHCDGEMDCADKSDEIGCSKVYISSPPPAMIVLEEHATFTVTCIAKGVPTPEVIWRLNWGHIPPKCSYTSVNGFGTLTCPDIQTGDQGAYSCEAINNRGSVFAVPDTILVVNKTQTGNVCSAGYFNSEARVPDDCISCFCFGATTKCTSAELFIYQIPSPSDVQGSYLAGVVKPEGQQIQITDEPISDIFSFNPDYDGVIVTRVGKWSPRNIYPYVGLPETYYGSQLTSYGGYIKYTIRSVRTHSTPAGYNPLPDIIIKGGDTLLVHSVSRGVRINQEASVSVRLFQGDWQKVTRYGLEPASREDIMMVLAQINAILIRGEVGGSGVMVKNFQMDSAGSLNIGQGPAPFVEECSCPEGYSGLSCQKCSPGYVRLSSGPWLGRCTKDEPPCPPGYYGNPSVGETCKLCPCPLTNPANQFSRTCSLESDGQVTCDCPVGYQGRQCEACAAGYVGNPLVPGDSCRPYSPPVSRCDPRGTTSERNGVCRCKANAVGTYCSECASESFHLSNDNIFGCSQCFCMGVTRACTSSSMMRSPVTARFGSPSSVNGVNLLEWESDKDTLSPIPVNSLRTDPQQHEITFQDFDRSKTNAYYWSLPDRFNGDKITSYGGNLNYTVRHVPSPGGSSSKNNAPDLQLISKNDITLVHYSRVMPGYDGVIVGSVPILEQHWQRSDGKPADREHILMALADLENVLIKATYTTRTEQASLVSASLEVADERGNGGRAVEVEQCQCPQGYLGPSCEDCAPGYTRSLGGLYLGFCELCKCNGHSDQCHPETGECFNCEHNTMGNDCEECQDGYEGDATVGSPNDCGQSAGETPRCSCDRRGTLSPVCSSSSNICRCKANVEGASCNQCKDGYFKLSEDDSQGCSPCYCSNTNSTCSEAKHLFRQQIPTGIVDNSHGFVLTTVTHINVINANFELNVPRNELSYDFGPQSFDHTYFWSLPAAFTGNRIKSYGGNIYITQKFDTNSQRTEYSSPDMNVLLEGDKHTIYWTNPERLQSGTPMSYMVPLTEENWYIFGSGRPVSRFDFLATLGNLKAILVKATLSESMSSTAIADVAMDTAEPVESLSLAEDIELCNCPANYGGSSCETCRSGYYHNSHQVCERCPCSGNEESCKLGPGNRVICNCKPSYFGLNCASISSQEEEVTNTIPVEEESLEVEIDAPKFNNLPVGDTATFRCSARSRYSQYPLKVTWSKEGGSMPLGRFIEDSNRGVLMIQDLKVTDSGTYVCQASDGYSSKSVIATLIVPANDATPPVVTLTNDYASVNEGEPIEILCEATGNPTPTLTWVRTSRRPLNPEYTFTDGIFRISSARESDKGEYRCLAINSAGRDQKTAVVQVAPRNDRPSRPPALIISPVDPILKKGESLTISCSVDPSVPANLLTWTRENDYLPSNFQSSNGKLWIDHIQPEDAGVYKCTADYANERITPVIVTITVEREDIYPSRPVGVTVDRTRANVPEGQSLTIKCEPSGYPLPVIHWTKDGDSGFGPGVSQRGNALVISRARLSDRGIYVCIGSSSDGSVTQASSIVGVERREIPVVQVWPQEVQSVALGNSVRFQCRVTQGIPDPAITWSRPSGRPLSANTRLLPDGVLSVSSVSVNEDGTYTCTASNVAGEGSVNATIVIQSLPTISIYPDTYIEVNAGKDVVVECRASGYPEPSVQWSMVSPQNRQIDYPNRGTSTLTLANFDSSMEGEYSCSARNDAGETNESVRLTLVDNEIDTGPVRGDIAGGGGSPSNEYNVRINSPKHMTANTGDSLKVECSGSNVNQRLTWIKDNPTEHMTFSGVPGRITLKLTDISVDDAGVYRCSDANEIGGPTFDEFILDVNPEGDWPQPPAPYEPSVPNEPQPNWPPTRENMYNDAPAVHSASLGATVQMPCNTNLTPPVTFHWERPYARLSRSLLTNDPTLTLTSLTENDAGPYICRVSKGALKMETRLILKVTNVVPRFGGNSFISLKKLEDSYLYFDIEISIKPQDNNGVILFTSEKPDSSGDMISLALLDGYPEFRFALGSGSSVLIRGDRPLSLNEWHNIKISRSRRDGYLYVDGKGPFSSSVGGKGLGLDLEGPLYIGGVPRNQYPDDFTPRNGFVGCIGKLVLENVDVPLMKEAQFKNDVQECDSCSPNSCQNRAVCQEALNERGYSCLCPEGYSGLDCSSTGDACVPGLCGPGKCSDTSDSYQCSCPIGYAGNRCETKLEIEYPAFGGGAYLAFPPPKAMRHLEVSLRLKTPDRLEDGLIIYWAESRHGHGDFTSLALKDNFLEYRYDTGTGTAILRSKQPLNPNQSVNVSISRVLTIAKLQVEGQDPVTNIFRNGKVNFDLKTPFYVGGYDSERLRINKGAGVENGFRGCITDVKVNNIPLDIMTSLLDSSNVYECGTDVPETRHRGDIPDIDEAPAQGQRVNSVCAACRNGGFCRDPATDTECECSPEFHGRYCEESARDFGSPCDTSPCQRGGTCRPERSGLFKCDCPLGTGGYNCQDRVDLIDNLSLTGEGYVELPEYFLPHDNPSATEVIALAFTTSEPDGLLVFQGEKGGSGRDGDFIMLSIAGGYVELQWELGDGINTVTNNRVQVSDGQRHQVVVKRTASEAILEVDGTEEFGKATGMTQTLNADSNIYIGGTPSNMTESGLIGFNGCIHQIEFQDSGAIHLGINAFASRNANPCSRSN